MAGSFSFDTPEEVMHVLASIRASNLDPASQGQLRDLVLSYTNGGKDPSLKIQIERQLRQQGVVPNVTPATLQPAEPVPFGSSRNVPSFSAPAAPTKKPAPTPPSEPAPTPAPQKPDPQPSAPATPPPVAPTDTAAPRTADANSAPVVAESSEPPVAAAQPQHAEETTTAAPAVTPPAAGSAPEDQPEHAVSEKAAPRPEATSAGAVDDDALARIREIKAAVNEQVGNPVNLVDIDNEVGREYMAALLGAMKQLNGGGDIARAMERLEAAFTAVEQVVENRNNAPASAPEPATPAQPKPNTPAIPTVGDTSGPSDKPNQEDSATEADAVSVPIQNARRARAERPIDDDSASRWANTEIRMPSAAERKEAAAVKQASAQTTTNQTAPGTPTDASSVDKAAKPAPVIPTAPATPTVDLPPAAEDPTPQTAKPVTPIKPLSQTGTPLKSVADLPAADSLETSATGDPLFTREVDDGLNQLLTDWVLFKKSGLLGTGPKGVEHPLFQKIKGLEIPVLLAGRFEGATQEIKQSITDYMNGWRYEQGIIYEQGETFEHYLRRVIRHILDLQK